MTMDIATLGIRVDATDVRGATGDLDRLGGAAGRTSTSISATERAAKLLSVAFASIGAAALARDLLKTIEQVQNLEVRLTGLTKSAKDYAETQKYLTDISKQHHKSNLQLQESFAGLLAIEQTGIITRQQSKQILEGMSNAQSKTGASADALKQSTLGLSQALSMGTLQWEEMKQVTEPIPGLLTKIAEAAGYTGKSAIGDFKNVVSAGQVTSDMFGRIMVDALSSYQGAAEAAGDTLTAKYADIGNAWTELAKAIEEPVVNVISPILELITEQINGLAQDLRELNDFYNQIKSAAGYNTGGAPDNGMAVNLTGRAKPPAQADQSKTDSAAIRAEIEATAASTKGKKAHKEAMSEEQKAIIALANAYENQISTLLRSIALEGKSSATAAAEYDVQNGALKGLTEAKKLYFLQQTAILQNKQLETKAHESEKSELDSLIDKYNQLTLSARDYKLTQLNAQGITGTEQAPIMAQFDKNAGAEATKKATDDATASLDAYNKKLDDANTKTSDLGAVTSAIFDGALGGITAMAGAFDAMVASIDANTKKLQENADAKKLNEATVDPVKKAANFEKYAKAEAKLNNDNVKASLTGASQMAGAASQLFDKKSSAAKAFHNIEIGLSVLRLAMDIKEIASSMTKTAVKTAEGASTMFAQSGWLGFAGVAAMMAVMAGLGFASGGGGGSATPPKSNDGTGTVLGDSSAKSESLAKTNDLLKNIHASEYVELRGINAGVNNLSKSILNTVTQLFQGGGLSGVSLTQSDALTGISKSLNTLMAIGTGGLSILVSKIPLIGGIFDKVNSFLFGGKQTQSVVGQGIETWGTPLGGVILGGNVQTGQYADIKTHTSGGLFGKSKDSYATGYQAVSDDMQKALNDVFKNVSTNLMVVAKSLGNNLTDTVKKAIIPAMRVDLMGLTGEDAAKKLTSVINATLDTMSSDIFGKVVGKYQQLGEGMFETASRIVMEVEIVKDAFAQSGKAMPKLSVNAISMADALVQAAGGLEEFQKRFEFFIDKFTSDPEKQTRTRKYLQGAFRDNNLFDGKQIGRMLNSRDAYGNAVDAAAADVAKYAGSKKPQDIAREERAVERYSLLLEMAPKVDEFISYNEKLTKDTLDMDIKLAQSRGNGLDLSKLVLKSHAAELKLLPESLRGKQQEIWNNEIINKQTALSNTLMKAQGRTAEALAISRKKELDAMEPSLRATQEAINKQDDLNKTQNLSWQLLELMGKSEQVLNEKRAVALLGLSATDAEIQRAINTQEDLKKATENAKIAEQDLAKARAEALANAQGAATKAMSVLQKAVDAERKQLTTKYNADIKTSQTAVDLLSTSVDKLKSLSTSLKNALAGMVAPNSDAINRKNAQAFIATALILAKSGMAGSIDETKLNDALGVVAKPSEDLFATFEDYQRDFLKTSIDISNLADATESQATKAMTQLDVAKAQLEAITTGYEAESLRLDAILTSAQDQIDAINGTTIAVMSITDALKNLGRSLSTLDANQNPVDSMYKNLLGRQSDTAGADYWKSNLASGSSPSDIAGGFVSSAEFTNNANATGDAVKSIYQTLLGRVPDSAGYDYWKSSLASGATVADIATSIMQSDEYAKIKAIRGYASGGTHGGGWRIVGENGPELENTGASRIFSNPQSKSLLSMDELVAELQALRAEMRAGQEAIANNTRQTTKILRDVTQDGTSITTSVAA